MLWRLLGEYDAESTTYTALAGPKGSSPYNPDFSGKLIGLRVVMNRSAATSLINHVQFKLSCTTFTPNSIECGVQGSGLQTAPALQPSAMDWQVDQPVQSGVPITIEARNNTVDTPVTVSVMLYGLFVC
jgi:hypothetical protein